MVVIKIETVARLFEVCERPQTVKHQTFRVAEPFSAGAIVLELVTRSGEVSLAYAPGDGTIIVDFF